MSTEATQEDRSPSYLPSDEADPAESARLIREGLPAEAFEWIKAELGLTVGTLGDIVHISRRTASRRKKEGRLKPDESERVLRLIRIYQRAAEVLGTGEDAREWLQEENYALGEETPLQFADTEPGARRVRQLLGQIEHGIVS
jgi:putative toxin-antitoxin system antitoxin component (TIGR02293 family)